MVWKSNSIFTPKLIHLSLLNSLIIWWSWRLICVCVCLLGLNSLSWQFIVSLMPNGIDQLAVAVVYVIKCVCLCVVRNTWINGALLRENVNSPIHKWFAPFWCVSLNWLTFIESKMYGWLWILWPWTLLLLSCFYFSFIKSELLAHCLHLVRTP